MKIAYRTQTDPYFNLAAEEYLLKTATEDLLVFWRNAPCVVIGKHQNPYVETNRRFLDENGIPVIRRISGGGAVYHDLGNLNFSFIYFVNEGAEKVNFDRFLAPIASVLRELGVDVEIGKRHDLLTNGLKFSGNAEHVYKNKVLHHGTLLFDSNLDHLQQALSVKSDIRAGAAVSSVRSSVTNLLPFFKEPLSGEKFTSIILKNCKKQFQVADDFEMSEPDLAAIQELAQEKYRTWEWNYGYTPAFSFTTKFGKKSEYEISVKNGIIQQLTLLNGWNSEGSFLKNLLTGCRFDKNEICAKCANENQQDFVKELIEEMF